MDRVNRNIFTACILLFFISAGVNCNKISLSLLSAGDVVNEINLDQLTGEFLGNLFNGEEKYVEKNVIDFTKTLGYENFFDCGLTFAAGYYPEIKVEASKKIDFDNSKLTASVLGIDDRYISNNYFCFGFKQCVVKKNETVLINLNTASDFPEDVKSRMKQLGISEAWKENETSYVSSIMTGDCLYQISVYDQPDPSVVFDPRDRTPIHIGQISSASHNETLEKWVGDFLKNSGPLLVKAKEEDKYKIYKQLQNAAIISLNFKLLPVISS